MTNLFAENSDVAFMDVNLREDAIRQGPNGEAYNPGAGGWPTVRYFNKKTGIAGGSYIKKTDDPMCTELGKEDNMVAYVEEYAKTALCAVATGKGCSEKEIGYIAKSKAKTADELQEMVARLESMDGASMAPQLFQWLTQRKKILNQLVAASAAGETGGSDEL